MLDGSRALLSIHAVTQALASVTVSLFPMPGNRESVREASMEANECSEESQALRFLCRFTRSSHQMLGLDWKRPSVDASSFQSSTLRFQDLACRGVSGA